MVPGKNRDPEARGEGNKPNEMQFQAKPFVLKTGHNMTSLEFSRVQVLPQHRRDSFHIIALFQNITLPIADLLSFFTGR